MKEAVREQQAGSTGGFFLKWKMEEYSIIREVVQRETARPKLTTCLLKNYMT